MAQYLCSPRAHWFEAPRETLTFQSAGWHPHPALCTCLSSPILSCPVHGNMALDGTNGGDFVPKTATPTHTMSDEDVNRIAKRVVEMLREIKP